MAQRLDAVCEETLLTLVRRETEEERRLRLAAYREGDGAVIEFVVASRDENVQDRLALLGDEPGEARPRRRCRSGCCAGSRRPSGISSIAGWMS